MTFDKESKLNSSLASNSSHALKVVRLRFEVECLEKLNLPEFTGSLFRGVFGNQLRKLSCMTRQRECAPCPLRSTCPYSLIFETPSASQCGKQLHNPPRPYVMEEVTSSQLDLERGDDFSFGMVLFGYAISQIPLIILAWEKALSLGLRRSKTLCQLRAVYTEGNSSPVYLPGQVSQNIPAPYLSHSGFDWNNLDRITLQFMTPFRLLRQGKRIPVDAIDANLLLMALARRYQLLMDTHQPGEINLDFGTLKQEAAKLAVDVDMKWQDQQRYSKRQNRAIPIGGFIGELTLTGKLTQFGELLEIGQWIHIGKEATFGLGRYRLINAQLQGTDR